MEIYFSYFSTKTNVVGTQRNRLKLNGKRKIQFCAQKNSLSGPMIDMFTVLIFPPIIIQTRGLFGINGLEISHYIPSTNEKLRKDGTRNDKVLVEWLIFRHFLPNQPLSACNVQIASQQSFKLI